MNNRRRQKLRIALTELENAHSIVSDVYDEESDSLSNMPENLESSDRYMDMESNVDHLEEIQSDIYDIINTLSELL